MDFNGNLSKSQKGPQIIGKALPSEGFRIAFPQRRKMLWKPIENQPFESQNSVSENVIKRMGF